MSFILQYSNLSYSIHSMSQCLKYLHFCDPRPISLSKHVKVPELVSPTNHMLLHFKNIGAFHNFLIFKQASTVLFNTQITNI